MENTALSKSTGGTPADLHKRKLPIKEIDGQLFRISQASRAVSGVIYYGKNQTERFDDPSGKYGVCYLGEDPYAAFIEVFGQAREILLDLRFVHARALATLRLSGKVHLVDITAHGAAWIGAAGEVAAGEHGLSQKWSLQLYLHPENVDGIYYRCRHDNSRMSIALFDKQPGLLTVERFDTWADSSMQPLLGQLLDHYRFSLKI